jgi:hypothetical protein
MYCRAYLSYRAVNTTIMELFITNQVLQMYLGIFAIATPLGIAIGLLARAMRGIV